MSHDYRWSEDKNASLRQQRNFGFEDVVAAIEAGGVLADEPHSNPDLAHQRKMYVDMNAYVVVVPYVKDGESLFFKTAFPSRKATRYFLGRGQ